MGFFSSRKEHSAPNYPLSSSSERVASVKQRWFDLSRSSKHSLNEPGPSKYLASFSDVTLPRSSFRTQRNSEDSVAGPTTDRTTATLAQRLKELANANADGLLGDDEYRLLKQNLFERFGAGSQLPAESPVVRVSGGKMNTPSSTSLQVDSNFRVTYAPSTHSNTSHTSTVTSAIKGVITRVSGRRSQDKGLGVDADGIPILGQSVASEKRKELSRQPSNLSLRNNLSPRYQADAFSLSSQKTGKSSRTARTSASKGPPSAYKARRIGKYSNGLDDDGHSDESSAELRAEITALEEEMRQVLKSFEGLEISASTRRGPSLSPHASPYAPALSSPIIRPSSLWTVTPERLPPTNPPPVPPLPPPPPLPSTGPSVAQRKASLGVTETVPAKSSKASFFSRKKSTPVLTTDQKISSPESTLNESPVPPPPPLPGTVNPAVPRSDPNLDSIRRRKEETMQRYNDRLDYLRARLKGAELRERLIK
ncbi:uncharacterized protein EI90DRAFT_3153694 [Cantharellus anzutake]|uniref:uncharacterized protein n=1 Tax=Cantharellus anzutake TaxID=1750568 RepID=UPI0019088601|nr:uncharacterized protein EI90DRAFT_3153694 [Cantharellus anzutake]KAF8333513.1 hypothetical protein EI90DRAFT_3153694 [Cantharellus anzutake]